MHGSTDSEEEARASLLYSYKHTLNGFAAILSQEEATKLSGTCMYIKKNSVEKILRRIIIIIVHVFFRIIFSCPVQLLVCKLVFCWAGPSLTQPNLQRGARWCPRSRARGGGRRTPRGLGGFWASRRGSTVAPPTTVGISGCCRRPSTRPARTSSSASSTPVRDRALLAPCSSFLVLFICMPRTSSHM
jgi:hypothetical protein